jgi:hypothetical protein
MNFFLTEIVLITGGCLGAIDWAAEAAPGNDWSAEPAGASQWDAGAQPAGWD